MMEAWGRARQPTRILLTGAATLLGAEVLKQLMLRWDIEAILLLMPADELIRHRDLERLEAYLGPMPPTARVVAADMRLFRFGLSPAAWDELAASFDIGLHCAHRDVKDQNLEAARRVNLGAVETWIHLLTCNPELRLHHLSTAFVGGTRRGLLTEFDLDCGQGFHNTWERSKFEAEVRLRESPVSDRVTIYRPSHVLGRTTGEAFELGCAYPLLATLGAALVLPGDARARIDFVPADYVAASMVALACSGATGTFHLACGWHSSLTVQQTAVLVANSRGRSRGARLLARGILWPLGFAGSPSCGGLSTRSLAFATARDLLHQGPVFDTYRADLALAALGIHRPRPEQWMERAVRCAEARCWERPPADEWQSATPSAELPALAAEAALLRKDPTLRAKRFHQVGDVNVAYRDIGEGEPVVFLHGLSGAHAWDGVVQRVAAHRRALVIETLGLSDTEGPKSADFGLAAQSALVRGLLSALEIPAAHIVGNDIGGVIAQIFAVRWPHCVKSLVLSDCDSRGPWPPPHMARLAALVRLPGAAAAWRALMRVPAVARSSAGLGKLVHDKGLMTTERLAHFTDALAGNPERRMRMTQFLRSLGRTDLTTLNHQLGELRTPAMIIWGADNACYSPSWAKTLYDAIPGARRIELIPFAGLSCHEERPDLFASLLREFFNDVAAGAVMKRRHATSQLS
jgi:pimeloyl-ACP methyl ester carboxylesterase/thioester reductase-like protein